MSEEMPATWMAIRVNAHYAAFLLMKGFATQEEADRHIRGLTETHRKPHGQYYESVPDTPQSRARLAEAYQLHF